MGEVLWAAGKSFSSAAPGRVVKPGDWLKNSLWASDAERGDLEPLVRYLEGGGEITREVESISYRCPASGRGEASET